MAAPPTKQAMMDNVETAIDALITGGAVSSYSTSVIQLTKLGLRDLMSWRDKLKKEIAGGSSGRNYAELVDST